MYQVTFTAIPKHKVIEKFELKTKRHRLPVLKDGFQSRVTVIPEIIRETNTLDRCNLHGLQLVRVVLHRLSNLQCNLVSRIPDPVFNQQR